MPSVLSLQISRLILLFGLIGLMTNLSYANDGISYWVSRNFQESPNVNLPPTEQRWVRKSVLPEAEFAPQIADLSYMGVERGSLERSQIRLCFDNRSILYARLNNLTSIESQNGYFRKRFCEYVDEASGVGIYQHASKDIDRASVTKGLLVSRQRDGKVTCEAIFTQVSIFELLLQENVDHLTVSKNELRPYGLGMTFFSNEKKFLTLLDRRDTILRRSSIIDGTALFIPASMTNTWRCLAPQFRKYWDTVIQECGRHSRILLEQNRLDRVYVPVLENLKAEIISNSRECLEHK